MPGPPKSTTRGSSRVPGGSLSVGSFLASEAENREAQVATRYMKRWSNSTGQGNSTQTAPKTLAPGSPGVWGLQPHSSGAVLEPKS